MKIDSFSKWLKYWWNIRFKVRLSRTTIKFRKFKKTTFNPVKPEIDKTQMRAIELLKALLKNKNTNLIHSPESSTRIIESEFMLVTMVPNANEYLINIIDENENSNTSSYEVHIPKEHGFEIVDEFDLEIEKRFRVMEASRKKNIVEGIDKLIIKVQTNKN